MTEILSRWVYRSRDVNIDVGKVKSSFFSGDHPKGFSVYNTSNINEHRIWFLEKRFKTRTDVCIGRCDLNSTVYTSNGLSIIKSPPNPRHRDLIGFPIATEIEEASKLSKRAKLVLESKFIRCP